MSSRWQHKLFKIPVCFKRWITTNHKQGTIENPRSWGWWGWKHTPGPHWKDKRSCYTLTTSPLPQANTASLGGDTEPTFLQWKREPKVDTKLPQYFRTLAGRPMQVSLPGNHQGNFWSLTTGNQIKIEKSGRAYSKQILDLGRYILVCSGIPRKDPSQQICPFADLNQSPCLDRDLS